MFELRFAKDCHESCAVVLQYRTACVFVANSGQIQIGPWSEWCNVPTVVIEHNQLGHNLPGEEPC